MQNAAETSWHGGGHGALAGGGHNKVREAGGALGSPDWTLDSNPRTKVQKLGLFFMGMHLIFCSVPN